MRKWFGWGFILLLIPLSLSLLLSSGQAVESLKSVPEALDERVPLKETSAFMNSYIKDSEGAVISELTTEGQNRIFVRDADIPPQMKELFLQSEDKRFYEHAGLDFEGTARAMLVNAKNKSLDQGGSTITQQLARNLYLNHERTYNRKLSELLISVQLERKWSKEKILESYLNTIYFQNRVYGVGAAADYYFSKSLKALTTAEMAYLASIPNNPSYYNPLKYPERTKKRQERLLQLLAETGMLNSDQLKNEKDQPIKLAIKKKEELYPDYTDYVMEELKQAVATKDSLADPEQISRAASDLIKSGIVIETYLNPFLQERIYKANEKYSDDSHQSAAVIIDHNNHQIVAMSGGNRYKKHEFNRAFQARRQPGSAIKPLLDYVPYIEKSKAGKFSLINADRLCIKTFCPENYSKKEYGMVTLEKAFSQSYNTPAVRMLKEVGIEKAAAYLKPFNFSGSIPADNYAAALGGVEIGFSPLELANAYTAFGNGGQYQSGRAIKRILSMDGSVLFEWKESPKQVWSKETNTVMRDLLGAVVKKGTGKIASFETNYIGGKTGTTNDYNDLWFSGLTDRYTAAVWFGKDNNGSIESIYKNGSLLKYWKMIMGGDQVAEER
ncbi:penicillin-binding protein [Metabacillus sp. KIGAM252]|uniref:Penicillin-binding protein n=1 Tax=Metabacillus flavus TaxID=2823519 RepID=A0ABS5LIB9_9BACI|nr:transglycosylase domain-containing protein [Metabacillus flavus]MBS2970313.1 penicillin-binding protein [Metabacillus flavus]